jgi:hypothetical protein
MGVKHAVKILVESDPRMRKLHLADPKAARARLSFVKVVCVRVDKMNRRKGHNYLPV